MNRDTELRSLRDPDERTRTLWRPSFLPEGVGIPILTLFIFRVPTALTYFEFQTQDAVLELSGGIRLSFAITSGNDEFSAGLAHAEKEPAMQFRTNLDAHCPSLPWCASSLAAKNQTVIT